MSRTSLKTCLMLGALIATTPSVAEAHKPHCATIRSGTITTEDGEPIGLGFDEWGYNYQAHLFVGGYCDAQRDAAWCQPYADVKLVMAWNDAWLSNKDCDGDGLLDQHRGFDSYRGSGAWIVNASTASYEQDGRTCYWSNYLKIVAAPLDAELVDGVWYTARGRRLGEQIWDEFAIVKELLIDPCGGVTTEG